MKELGQEGDKVGEDESNLGRRAGQYATGWSLHCFFFTSKKFRPLSFPHTSKKEKGEDWKPKIIGIARRYSVVRRVRRHNE